MLDAHQLNVFLVAAETLNFTLAAQRLHMSQPSVSQHIQTLERHFDAALFVRSGRNIQLTDAGLTLVPLARELVKQSIRTEEAMASLGGEIHGHLLVSCSTTPGKYILPQILANFHHQHPNVNVSCIVSSQRQSIEMLNNGEVHFALASLSQESCKDAEFQKFMCDEIVLIAPPDHPWSERGAIQLEELYEGTFIMREESSGTYDAVQQSLIQAGISIYELNTLMTLGNSEAIGLAVQEGLGVGFISTTVLKILEKSRVTPVKISDFDICRDIYIGRHVRLPATLAQTAFWNSIQDFDIPISSQTIFQS